MKPIRESFSVVLIGSWNPAILRPEWIAKHLFNGEEIEWQVMVPIGDGNAPTKFRGKNLEFVPTVNRLEIKPVDCTIENIQLAINAAKDIVTTLNHTPVSAAGVNFGFSDESNEFSLEQIAGFNDYQKFDSEKYELTETQIIRSYKIMGLEDTKLNLKVSPRQNSTFEFNFHKNSNSAQEIQDHLEKVDAQKYKEIIEEIVEDIYQLTIED